MCVQWICVQLRGLWLVLRFSLRFSVPLPRSPPRVPGHSSFSSMPPPARARSIGSMLETVSWRPHMVRLSFLCCVGWLCFGSFFFLGSFCVCSGPPSPPPSRRGHWACLAGDRCVLAPGVGAGSCQRFFLSVCSGRFLFSFRPHLPSSDLTSRPTVARAHSRPPLLPRPTGEKNRHLGNHTPRLGTPDRGGDARGGGVFLNRPPTPHPPRRTTHPRGFLLHTFPFFASWLAGCAAFLPLRVWSFSCASFPSVFVVWVSPPLTPLPPLPAPLCCAIGHLPLPAAACQRGSFSVGGLHGASRQVCRVGWRRGRRQRALAPSPPFFREARRPVRLDNPGFHTVTFPRKRETYARAFASTPRLGSLPRPLFP